jgi:two-component system response regulator RegX3
MAAAAMTFGVLDPRVAAVASKIRLHAEGVRIVVVHATSEGPSPLGQQLREANFEVSVVPVGRSMVDELLVLAPDVVVIGHSTRAFDVTRVCHDITESLTAPVVVVSADDGYTETLEVAVLDAGADDFLRASTSTALLLARIRATTRRRPAPTVPLMRLTLGDVLIDLQAHVLFIAGAPVQCSPLQFLLLFVLAKRSNQVVSRDTLLANVWGAEPDTVDPSRVRIAISGLRRVLGSGPERPRIETVSHIGYRLAVDGVPGTAV